MLDPPVFPDLRIEEQGRIVELALGRTALLTVAVVLALAPLTVRGQAVESVGGGHPLGRCSPASCRDLRIAPALGACTLGLAGTALGVTSRGLLTTTDHVDSVRGPPLAGSSRSRDLPRRSRDRSRSCGRPPPSSDRSRSK